MTVFLIVLAVMVFVGCVLLVWSWCRAAALGDQGRRNKKYCSEICKRRDKRRRRKVEAA